MLNADQLRQLVTDFETRYSKYDDWVFDYMYPGCFSYCREPDGLCVFFTPDYNDDGVIALQVTTAEGDCLDVPEAVELPYAVPLTAEWLADVAHKTCSAAAKFVAAL